jgi:hypothetical protein
MTGKSSWVHSSTQGLFPPVAGSKAYYCGDKLDLSPTSGGEWTMGNGPFLHRTYLLLLDMTMRWHCNLLSVYKRWFQAISLPLLLFWSGFCTKFMLHSDVFVNLCNMWTVVTKSCTVLVVSLRKFESLVISWTTGFIWVQVCKLSGKSLILYLSSYKLGGSITEWRIRMGEWGFVFFCRERDGEMRPAPAELRPDVSHVWMTVAYHYRCNIARIDT